MRSFGVCQMSWWQLPCQSGPQSWPITAPFLSLFWSIPFILYKSSAGDITIDVHQGFFCNIQQCQKWKELNIFNWFGGIHRLVCFLFLFCTFIYFKRFMYFNLIFYMPLMILKVWFSLLIDILKLWLVIEAQLTLGLIVYYCLKLALVHFKVLLPFPSFFTLIIILSLPPFHFDEHCLSTECRINITLSIQAASIIVFCPPLPWAQSTSHLPLKGEVPPTTLTYPSLP